MRRVYKNVCRGGKNASKMTGVKSKIRASVVDDCAINVFYLYLNFVITK